MGWCRKYKSCPDADNYCHAPYRKCWEEPTDPKDKIEAPKSSAPSGQAEFALLSADPWPLKDVLAKLVEATNILLIEKNYDRHGWELINAARDRAVEIMKGI